MAGIEKVCELSGDRLGSEMYIHKRNHIQVCPKYRKQFRGAWHTLYISMEKEGYERLSHYFTRPKEKDIKPVYKIDYCLHVPALQGRVDGLYYNHTYGKIGAVKRRLKRMLRCKKLNIVYVNTQEELFNL